jgi:uncharacterized repeat protein (TIGR03803 family)
MNRLTSCISLLVTCILWAAYAAVQAATPGFETLYNFAGADGSEPDGLAIGAGGVLYGVTYEGGTSDRGTVFSLTPPASPGGAWTQAVLYSFPGGSDGVYPTGCLVVGPAGVLYGVTEYGGYQDGGVVFALSPPASPGGVWIETVLYTFTGGHDGKQPDAALLRASNGALYGTTVDGGANSAGVVFELIPPSSPGSRWTEKVLHTFGAPGDGRYPQSRLTYSGGLLYGTTYRGGAGTSDGGAIFSLAPPASAGGAWTEAVLYSFSDGSNPITDLAAATNGVLYGSGDGGVFSLTPPITSGAPWTLTVLHTLDGTPGDNLLLNPSSGILYGTTLAGTHEKGTVFQLTPPGTSGGAWTYTVLYTFTGTNGQNPSVLVPGSGGVLYGCTQVGGSSGNGTVFALTL